MNQCGISGEAKWSCLGKNEPGFPNLKLQSVSFRSRTFLLVLVLVVVLVLLVVVVVVAAVVVVVAAGGPACRPFRSAA